MIRKIIVNKREPYFHSKSYKVNVEDFSKFWKDLIKDNGVMFNYIEENGYVLAEVGDKNEMLNDMLFNPDLNKFDEGI